MKEHNKFFIDQLYRGGWSVAGWPRWGATLFRIAFAECSTGNVKKLPLDNDTIYSTIINSAGARVQLKLTPPNPRGVRKHRVFVYCDKCGVWVPAGRVHQHRC